LDIRHIKEVKMPRPQQQSALRAPLNEMLGTGANVRLLRVLALAEIPLGAGELARRARLGRTGVYPALTSLERVGLVEFVGAGATRQVRLREAHPLAAPIARLFHAEAQRIESLASALRELLAQFSEAVTSAWIKDGSHACSGGDPEMMTLYIVAETRALSSIVDRMEDQLANVERAFQVHIEVVALSRSEVQSRVPSIGLDDVLLLAGVPPNVFVERAGNARKIRNLSVHGYHDVGARNLALAVATKLRRDPSMVRRVRANLQARMEVASDQERRELKEWLRIISTMSPARLQRFLVDDSERAVRLRQSLPALGLLTPIEREEALLSNSDDEVISAMARLR
jgi:predicted transcriptional regulator/uncharacterized protein YutE (UPF0331/DUF86 family)